MHSNASLTIRGTGTSTLTTRAAGMALGLLVAASGALAQVPDYDYQWATIGAVGNAPFTGPTPYGDIAPVGGVNYEYRMAKMEVTTAQWVEFANAASEIGADFRIGEGPIGGYRQVGNFPNGRPRWGLLTTIPNAGLLPVQGIKWLNAARLCNWLHNDKALTLEALATGAYDTSTFGRVMNPQTGGYQRTDALTHLPGAKFWIPTRDEWTKAAFFDPNRYGAGQGGYWTYSTSSDTAPIIGPESAGGQTNAGYTNYSDVAAFLLGAHPNTTSPWGLLDVSGGSQEWQETVIDPSRLSRFYGGSYAPIQFDPHQRPLEADLIYLSGGGGSPESEGGNVSLRIASAVPSPGACALGGVVSVFGFRRRR
jgi:formylglycine-generating enzyme required for sulfatase activity